MKRWIICGLFLAVCGISSGITIIKSGETKPMIEVMMYQTADGITPITTLTGENLTIYYSETPTGAALIGDEITLALSNWASDNTDWVSGAAIHVGHGMYRICLPQAAVDGAAGTYVTVIVTDETAVARNWIERIALSPPVNAVLSNGNVPMAQPTNWPIALDASGKIMISDASISSAALNPDLSFWGTLFAFNPQDYFIDTHSPTNSVGYMWMYPELAAQFSGLVSWDDTSTESDAVGDTSTTTIVYTFPPGGSSEAYKWQAGKEILIDTSEGLSHRYERSTIVGGGYNGSDGKTTLLLQPALVNAPKDGGEIYLGPMRSNVNPWMLVTNLSALAAGGDYSTLIFADATFFGNRSPLYCLVKVIDVDKAGGPVEWNGVCTDWNSTTFTMSVFPAMPFTPTAAQDMVWIQYDFGGLLPMDIKHYSNGR